MLIAPNDKKRTVIAAVRSLPLHALLLITSLMMSACQHIQLVDSPLPFTTNPQPNQTPTPQVPPTDHDGMTDKSYTPEPTKPFFILENWF